MLDLHCHIIPDLDDGARDLETSLAMARLAWKWGTDVIVATPHYCRPDQMERLPVRELLKKARALKRLLWQENCPLELIAGMELFATPELPRLLDDGSYLTLGNSRYLLLEFFFDERVRFMENCIEEVFSRHLVPVLAHPERYHAVQERPELAADWFRRGAVIQLNKGTIMGQLGFAAERTAWQLLRRGFAHVVASDAHSDEMRSPRLDGVELALKQELSPKYAAILLEENPRRILEDRPLVKAEGLAQSIE